LVPIEELTRSSSNESLLPEAISEALGISLAEVMDLYFRDDSDEEVQNCLVWDTIDRRRMNAEDEAWLAAESRRRAAVAEMVHRGGDDTYLTLAGSLNKRGFVLCFEHVSHVTE
jgi:hypothetical protein